MIGFIYKFKDIEKFFITNPSFLAIGSVLLLSSKILRISLWIGMDGGGIDILDLDKNATLTINIFKQ